MPATDAGETSGIRNLRPQPTSPEDNMYIDTGRENLNQYIRWKYFFLNILLCPREVYLTLNTFYWIISEVFSL